MAAVPSSSPSSDSRNSATHPVQPKREVDDVATNNGVFDVFEKKPDLPPQHFQPSMHDDGTSTSVSATLSEVIYESLNGKESVKVVDLFESVIKQSLNFYVIETSCFYSHDDLLNCLHAIAVEVLNSTEYIEKYQKYEADSTRRLMAKYFSKKNIYGGNIFEVNMTIDDETIMSSRWPCTRSFADPVQGFEDQSSNGSSSTAETPNNVSNGRLTPKKIG